MGNTKTKICYKTPDTVIICGNMLDDKIIPDGYIDLIVTSPPYNLNKEYTYGDSLTYEEYMGFSLEWLKKCLALLKDDGRLCVNIPLDTGKGGQKSISADLTVLAQTVGWNYKTTIVWNEGNISNRQARGSMYSAKTPSVIAPVELVVVFYKKQ